MTAALTERQVADGYDFFVEGKRVGRLVWLMSASEAHDAAGWWLVGVAGREDEAIYCVPEALAGDSDAARVDGESASLWFARTIIGDIHSGLLAGARPPLDIT
jgi:hypothetical protein